ncbi:MAG TPA: BACON domain-containing carbohydrate-binding protein, partial [Bacteroidales bacterium]|nr:BACON domain-containing carbohydrate-binding protein [Bacteroidales bacterium]
MRITAGGYGATEVINATGLTAGTTYYVRVYDYTGSSVPPTSYTFTICVTTPTPPQCAVTSFSPASIAHDPTAFSTNITVSANANCAYTVTGVCSWLSVTPASGYANISGQFTLSCVVQANTSATARTCTFYVNSTPFTVTQSGCAYNLSLASNSVSASGSTYNLSISTSSPCAWTVANPCSSWVNISQSSGTGTGNISLTVSPNTSCSTRSCTLTVTPGNATHTITQLANTPPTVSVSPANPFFCEGNGPVTITASGATLYN